MRYGESGGSRVTVLIYILIVVAAFYFASKVVPPYWAYNTMDDEVVQQLQMASINQEDVILDDLYNKAQELDIPVNKDDIIITRLPDGHINIKMNWSVTVDFGRGYKRVYDFEINDTNMKLKS